MQRRKLRKGEGRDWKRALSKAPLSHRLSHKNASPAHLCLPLPQLLQYSVALPGLQIQLSWQIAGLNVCKAPGPFLISDSSWVSDNQDGQEWSHSFFFFNKNNMTYLACGYVHVSVHACEGRCLQSQGCTILVLLERQVVVGAGT